MIINATKFINELNHYCNVEVILKCDSSLVVFILQEIWFYNNLVSNCNVLDFCPNERYINAVDLNEIRSLLTGLSTFCC